MKIVAFITGFN